MRRQLAPAVIVFLCFTLLVGVLYPLAVTAAAQLAFGDRANGSLVRREGVVIGSSLLGQAFTGARWFHPRPSAAGDGYDGTASGASNLGPTNPTLVRVADISKHRVYDALLEVFERFRNMTMPHGLIAHHGHDRGEHQHQQTRRETETESGECDGEHQDGRGAGHEC